MRELYVYRVLNRLTQEDIANILDISQSYYSKVEAGQYTPSEKLQMKIDELIKVK
ncbi:MAG: helix-turn-helix domain-containing protein [Bacillaceae bacterium]|nr:helix-turn-helix domain-containing protein [Bacillaceae bacterium]